MIVNIRGTSGSGKSTLARKIMAEFPTRIPLLRQGAKADVPGPKSRPYAYLFKHPSKAVDDLVVLGHYEAECGGCDTIPSFDAMYELAREASDQGFNVLMEGLLLSAESRRMIELAFARDVLVIGLDESLETCIDSVNERRWRKNPDKPGVNPKNTESKWKGTRSTMEKLTVAGVTAIWADREQAYEILYEALIDLQETPL